MAGPIVVAVDGPAASGKTTLARRLARANGLHFLDTGLLYRAVGKRLLEAGDRAEDEAAAEAAARSISRDDLDPAALADEAIGDAASKVAVVPAVRTALLAFQRDFAARPPGAVLAGRDIGSIVCPKATLKLFITAAPQVRAKRRYEELQSKGFLPIWERVLQDVVERDRRDSERAIAPLTVASDAVRIDTSTLDLDESLAAMQAALEAAIARTSGET